MPLRHSRRSWLSGPASITRGFAHRVSRAILCALRAERPRERVIEQHFRQSVTNAAIERNDHTIATQCRSPADVDFYTLAGYSCRNRRHMKGTKRPEDVSRSARFVPSKEWIEAFNLQCTEELMRRAQRFPGQHHSDGALDARE